MNELALFSGIGGISLGLKKAIPELRTICHVERNPYCAGVLIKNMEQGLLDLAPIWDDVCTFDGNPWRGKIDIISGGFPCQDISIAGKGKGLEGERSGLWFEMLRIISEVRPSFVLVENVAALFIRGIETVLGTLAENGYDAQWRIISAQEVGALHKRERIFIVAYCNSEGESELQGMLKDEWRRDRNKTEEIHDTNNDSQRCNSGSSSREERQIQSSEKRKTKENKRPRSRRERRNDKDPGNTSNNVSKQTQRIEEQERQGEQGFSWCEDVRGIEDLFNRSSIPQPLIRRKGDGLPFRLDRIKALGNAVLPQCAEKAAQEMIIPFL